MSNARDTSRELRGRLDGSSSFMAGGHQIIKPIHPKRKVPNWVKSDQKIRAILLRSFPKLDFNPRQRSRASRWVRVIHLYFRMQQTHGEVSEELSIPVGTVKTLIRNIKRVGTGRQANGRGLLGARPKGRPRKEAK